MNLTPEEIIIAETFGDYFFLHSFMTKEEYKFYQKIKELTKK